MSRRKQVNEIQQKDSRGSSVNGVAPAKGHSAGFSPASAVVFLAPSLLDYSLALSLIYGGCCTNVWTYERLLRMSPRIGAALTFSQMVFVTAQSLPSFLIFRRTTSSSLLLPKLKNRAVPLQEWVIQVIVLTTGSLLSNWAYAFNVPLPVQIVFRSAGLAVSMLLGFLVLGKRYSIGQIAAVALVSIGVIVVTFSKSSPSEGQTTDASTYVLGIVMLSMSLLLSGILGILQEKTYGKYGPCWREGLFYTHFLSLPIFLFLISQVKGGFNDLSKVSPDSYTPYLVLTGNLFTQLLCVSGVNQLTSRVSSVSTNLVLTTRKALSLCISIWLFGGGWNMQLVVGAGMVFLGSLFYTFAGSPAPLTSKEAKAK